MQTEFGRIRKLTGLSISDLAARLDYSPSQLYRWESGEATPRNAVLDATRRYTMPDVKGGAAPSLFRFIDLFAGIGGLRKAFETHGGECVFTSEWDKHAQKTYHANFQCDHPIDGDITKVPTDRIPEHDLLLAGFPCQPFSIAGVSKKNALGRPHGFRDKTQGTLFFDVARILEYHRPTAFLLENVKNLVGHDGGQTFRVILETLHELGYEVNYRVLDAANWLPQHRERIFIVGTRNGCQFDFDSVQVPDGPKPRLRSILHPEDGSEEPEPPFTVGDLAMVAEKYTLTPRLWEYLQEYAAKHRAKGNGFGYGLVGPDDTARTLSARYYKDGSEILIRQQNDRPRRLTPRECSRLMGFDLPGEKPFAIEVSDTQAYRQFGNAVAVPVVTAIAEQLVPVIKGEGARPRQASLFDQRKPNG